MTTPPTSAPRITLVRHGRSAYVHSGWLLDLEGLRRWRTGYDAAPLRDGDRPPATLVSQAEAAACLACSDLLRARHSAELLAPERTDVLVTPLLREIEFETPAQVLPAFWGARLPLLAWALVFYTRTGWARLRRLHPPGVDDAVLARAADAAAWLDARAADHGSVLAVTHASVRALIAAALVARGWSAPRRRPWREWSAWDFSRYG